MPCPLGFLFVCEQVSVRVKVKEEMTNIGRLSALDVGYQPVYQLPNDTSPMILPQSTNFFSEYARSKVVARVRVML